MKYIVLRKTTKVGNSEMTREFPIIFPDALIHADVAKWLALCDGMQGAKPVAAGFLSSMEVGAENACHGKSDTLKLASRGKQDDTLMLCYDYLHGMVD